MNLTVPAGRCSQMTFLLKDQFNNSLNYSPTASYFALQYLSSSKTVEKNGTLSASSCFGLFSTSNDYLTFNHLRTLSQSPAPVALCHASILVNVFLFLTVLMFSRQNRLLSHHMPLKMNFMFHELVK